MLDGDLHELYSDPPHNSLKPIFFTQFYDTIDKNSGPREKFCGEVPKIAYFKDFRAFFQKKIQNPKILILEKYFCHQKVASWWDMTFWKKKFFVGPPKTPQGGYFKDFRLIFIILGFKGLKMGQQRKVLSQISCIWVKYNLIFKKKNSSDPPDSPWGS